MTPWRYVCCACMKIINPVYIPLFWLHDMSWSIYNFPISILSTTDFRYSGPPMCEDNYHTDYLHGPHVIMGKPGKITIIWTNTAISYSLTELSFLIRYYELLYQSLIPNCKLTIKTLKQRVEISSDVENFIINGETSRIRCQRIINFLLVQLDITRNHEQFCNLFDTISITTDLPRRLRTGMHIE